MDASPRGPVAGTTSAPTAPPTTFTPVPAASATACPTGAVLGTSVSFNHANLSPAMQRQWRTYLGAVVRIDLLPTGNYSGDCIKEQVSLLDNGCPASVLGGSNPCAGHSCLSVGGSAGDAGTGTMLAANNSSFLDLHRTRNPASLLEGSGVNSCSYTCLQHYFCRSAPQTPIGTFLIRRNLEAGTLSAGAGSAPVHITTGSVDKIDLTPPPPPASPKGDFPMPRAGQRPV